MKGETNMPHISVKMLKGRTEEQKERLAKALKETLMKELGAGDSHTSVAIEDFTAQEWQTVFKEEITDKPGAMRIMPAYDPKSLL